MRLSSRFIRITGEGLERLKGLTNLSGLTLMQTEVNDELVDHVTKLKNLGDLSIRGAKISGSGLNRLTRMDKLRGLTLLDVQITGNLVEQPKPDSSLRVLTFSHSVITDAVAAHLAGLAGLDFLNLDESRVTDSAKGLRRINLYN